jgi:hypothetical protein
MASSEQSSNTTSADDSNNKSKAEDNKLRYGPCADIYEQLMLCSDRKDAVYGKKTLEACPSETDLLIKCVHKNPAFFLKKQS